MGYTEEEAEALLKLMGWRVRQVSQWDKHPHTYFRLAATNPEWDMKMVVGDTYNELLDEITKQPRSAS
jgi:hypothetical protein